MCFWNSHIQATGYDRQRTHWHGTVTADNTQNPVYAQAEVEAVCLPPRPPGPALTKKQIPA